MKYHPLFKQKYSSWAELENQIGALPTTKERGNAFEDFVYAYFELHRTLYQITDLYRIKDIPPAIRKKYSLEKKDSGIDGLIFLQSGQVAGYQAKFRVGREKPTYGELAKFWEEARLVDWHYTVANSYSLSKLCNKNKKHLSILVQEFEGLNQAFFQKLYELVNCQKVTRVRFSPDAFQKRMIKNIVAGFKEGDRGKLIAACGTGKTLTSLWVTEAIGAKRILFIAPSLALIKQTLEAWSEQSKEEFSYLCVCSDQTVIEEMDDWDISTVDLSVPVTTDPSNVKKFLGKKTGNRQIIFSTYQSLEVVSNAMSELENIGFEIIIFDEAHRTAGAKSSVTFGLALHDEYIPASKRLFMTATERLIRPWIIEKAKEYNRVVFSMDDKKLYGPVFDRLNFGEAIHHQLISDYRIIVAGVRQREIYDWIKQDDLLVDIKEGTDEHHTSAQNIFRQVMLVKAIQQFPIKKTITFHSSVAQAKAFINGYGDTNLSLQKVFSRLLPKPSSDLLYLDHVNGRMGAGDRAEIMDTFKSFPYGVISNSRCLTEGVDVPVVDSIYFVNPKNSLIDIVQACGRALRKPRDASDKMAFFIVPILIPDGEINDETINQIDFEMLHSLIQSLRDQDQRMEQWIDTINLQASKGQKGSGDGKGIAGSSPIILDLPHEFDIKRFEQQLYLRIAKVNGEPTRIIPEKIKYGKKERKSEIKRIFKTLGDYAVRSYHKNLVAPTLKKFTNKNQEVSKTKLKISHNNISHTERLGLLERTDKGYRLSPLGVQLYESKVTFDQVFARQMLRYFSVVRDTDSEQPRILFPYRTCLKILREVKTINFSEFVFGVYSILDSSDDSVNEAVQAIKVIRKQYPKLAILNRANRQRVLDDLNQRFGTNYTSTDLWAKKTTIVNQFIYFRDHLAIFDDIVKVTKQAINLLPGAESKIDKLLKVDDQIEQNNDPTKLIARYVEALVIVLIAKLI